mmetsp:Transcript_25636/g.83066  ORF Transcript_25636/g.83066 Transcript_25636/m.83066 type:complete len:281 (+) Transcript_25636:866-1708(+)
MQQPLDLAHLLPDSPDFRQRLRGDGLDVGHVVDDAITDRLELFEELRVLRHGGRSVPLRRPEALGVALDGLLDGVHELELERLERERLEQFAVDVERVDRLERLERGHDVGVQARQLLRPLADELDDGLDKVLVAQAVHDGEELREVRVESGDAGLDVGLGVGVEVRRRVLGDEPQRLEDVHNSLRRIEEVVGPPLGALHDLEAVPGDDAGAVDKGNRAADAQDDVRRRQALVDEAARPLRAVRRAVGGGDALRTRRRRGGGGEHRVLLRCFWLAAKNAL